MRFVVLGDPIDHSLSPVMHTAAFAVHGLDAVYAPRKADVMGVYEAVGEIRGGELTGANVTMPHKGTAASAADALDERAARLGVVNTLWLREGEVVGSNTDVDGVGFAVERLQLPGDTPVLILGSGATAAAAIVAMRRRQLSLSARRAEAAEALLKRLDARAEVVPWGQACDRAIVINATPIGMDGEPLPESVVEAASGLVDMVYASGETPAQRACRGRGIPVADGLVPLAGQAAESFRIWTGLAVDPVVMETAARAAT